MRQLLIFPLVILLSACQAGAGYRQDAGPAPAVTKVILNEAFSIRASRATEYIQGGRPVNYFERARYYPHCFVELRRLAKTATVIAPDTFTVSRIHNDRFMAAHQPVLLAFSGGGGDGGNPVMSTTYLYLSSGRQPNVWRLGCQVLTTPYEAHYVSLVDMQQVLGELITLE